MRFHQSCRALAGLGLTVLAVAPVQAQGLNGQPVNVSYRLSPTGPTGTPTFTWDDGTHTVSPAGASFSDSPFTYVNIAVTPTQIRFTLPLGAGSSTSFGAPSGYFSGFRIAETGGSPATITSFLVDPATSVTGFNLSSVSGDPTDIFANFQGLIFNAGQNVTLDIVAAPVPEASTTISFGLLLALGMGGLVMAAKRKKAASSL